MQRNQMDNVLDLFGWQEEEASEEQENSSSGLCIEKRTCSFGTEPSSNKDKSLSTEMFCFRSEPPLSFTKSLIRGEKNPLQVKPGTKKLRVQPPKQQFPKKQLSFEEAMDVPVQPLKKRKKDAATSPLHVPIPSPVPQSTHLPPTPPPHSLKLFEAGDLSSVLRMRMKTSQMTHKQGSLGGL